MKRGRNGLVDGAEKGAFSVFAILAAALMMVVVGAMFSLASRHHMRSQLEVSNIVYKGKADDMVLRTAVALEAQLPMRGGRAQAVLETVEEDGIRYRRAYHYDTAACFYHKGATEQLCTIVVAVEQASAEENWLPKVRSVGVFRIVDERMALDHWEP